MAFVDYYKVLGIEKSATPKEIKSAYRKLARKFHPDINPNDKNAHTNFQQINEANEVLSDPEKRKKYDEHGADWKIANERQQAQQSWRSASDQQQAGGFNGGFGGGQSEGDFSSFFESMFGGQGQAGGARTRQAKYRGEDYSTELHLELLDAYTSHKQTLTVNGANIRITIPAGIENGQTIKIPGHGGVGTNGGPNGDLFIAFSVANHSVFKRLENDLFATEDIDIYTAVLGGSVTMETLSGKVKLNVAPETQNGTKVKLKGKGFPVYKKEGHFGDLIITYNVKIPTNLTESQKALFTELSKS